MIKKVNEKDLMKDSLGRYRTSSLFIETPVKGNEAFWTMQDQDREVKGKVYPSLKQIYMTYYHIPYSEYEFAIDVFGSWDHWDRLSNESNKIIISMITAWRLEMEIKIRANSLKDILRTSGSSDSAGLAAAKYIAERGWEKKAGRPTKAAIEKETKVQAGINKAINDDASRIGMEGETSTKLH